MFKCLFLQNHFQPVSYRSLYINIYFCCCRCSFLSWIDLENKQRTYKPCLYLYLYVNNIILWIILSSTILFEMFKLRLLSPFFYCFFILFPQDKIMFIVFKLISSRKNMYKYQFYAKWGEYTLSDNIMLMQIFETSNGT